MGRTRTPDEEPTYVARLADDPSGREWLVPRSVPVRSAQAWIRQRLREEQEHEAAHLEAQRRREVDASDRVSALADAVQRIRQLEDLTRSQTALFSQLKESLADAQQRATSTAQELQDLRASMPKDLPNLLSSMVGATAAVTGLRDSMDRQITTAVAEATSAAEARISTLMSTVQTQADAVTATIHQAGRNHVKRMALQAGGGVLGDAPAEPQSDGQIEASGNS